MEYLYIIVLDISSILIMLRSIIYLQMDNYHLRLRGRISREILYNLGISLALILLTLLGEYVLKYNAIYYGVSISFLLVVTLILVLRKYKVSPKFTKRLQRLIYVFLAINFLFISILLLNLHYFRIKLPVFMLSDTIFVVNYAVMMLSKLLLNPIENKINNRYISKAKSKLSSMNKTKIIAITGSYAKTTIKNMLYTILGEKYNVACTPKSYNTPLGIAMSIEELSGDEDYFIVEMGARRKGDIKTLSDMVQPQYGIITGIAEQHLETFKDIDTIKSTKYELYESIPDDGLCVFSGFNDITTSLYEESDRSNSLIVGRDKYNILDYELASNGSKFIMQLDGNKLECNTSLIGRQNIENICIASAMAYYLSVETDKIISGISKIKASPHRLEVINNNNIIIIDDSYNANIRGVEMALDTLSLYCGRKIVATQGIVEAGRSESDINIRVGRYIAKTANIAVIIGKERKYILKGLIDANFNMQNIIEVKNLKEAERVFASLVRAGDTLLITNDLPDNY